MAERLLRGPVQRFSVASQFVTMVMRVFAPWSSSGDPAAWLSGRSVGTKLIQAARVPLRQASLGPPGLGDPLTPSQKDASVADQREASMRDP
jgi:hypothetical protein